jgi:hypothetical protein
VPKSRGSGQGQQKKWVVTTSPDRPIKDIAKDLAKAGFNVGQTLQKIGIITGSGDDAVAKKLRAIQGVVDVSPDMPAGIGPPDAPVTW